MNKLLMAALLVLPAIPAFSLCTESAKIEALHPRAGGWVHISLEGVTNMDLLNCGHGGVTGMMLNYNDSSGSEKGKEMLHSMILSAQLLGKELKLCATTCDSQHPTYTTLDRIDDFK